jgi:glucan phosphoethanolaminetransferase (alkaline phosphatase superfamily)
MNVSPEEKVLNAFCKLLSVLAVLMFCTLICAGFIYVLEKTAQNRYGYFLGGCFYMAAIVLLVRIISYGR